MEGTSFRRWAHSRPPLHRNQTVDELLRATRWITWNQSGTIRWLALEEAGAESNAETQIVPSGEISRVESSIRTLWKFFRVTLRNYCNFPECFKECLKSRPSQFSEDAKKSLMFPKSKHKTICSPILRVSFYTIWNWFTQSNRYQRNWTAITRSIL